MAVHLFQRLVAQPALGGIVDPLECQVVRRLGDDAQIGQCIAHFGALIEAETADDAVGHADGDEAVLDLAGLELRAHEDGASVEAGALAQQPLQLLAHPARFFRAIPDADDAQLVAAVPLGPQGLAQPLAIGRDQPGCGGEYMRGGAIVLLQPDHFRAGKIAFEAQDIGHFRAAPGID